MVGKAQSRCNFWSLLLGVFSPAFLASHPFCLTQGGSSGAVLDIMLRAAASHLAASPGPQVSCVVHAR